MSGFTQSIFNVMLSWLKTAITGIWDAVNSDSARAGLNWLGGHWLLPVAALIVAGVVIDYLVWLIRWRPFYVWRSNWRRFTRHFKRGGGRMPDQRQPLPPRRTRTPAAPDMYPQSAPSYQGYDDSVAYAPPPVYQRRAPEPVYEPQPVYEPEPAYEPEPVYEPPQPYAYEEPAAYQPPPLRARPYEQPDPMAQTRSYSVPQLSGAEYTAYQPDAAWRPGTPDAYPEEETGFEQQPGFDPFAPYDAYDASPEQTHFDEPEPEPTPMPRAPRAGRAGARKQSGVLTGIGKMARTLKDGLSDRDEEENFGVYVPPKPRVSKSQAFHAPVIPPNWQGAQNQSGNPDFQEDE